ncbi:MAG: S8 family serine peptidase [Planctomycetota bacterium]
MAVGATRPDGSRADFSSHGPTYDGRIKPDVMARGDSTWAAQPLEWGGGFQYFQGTSVACPLASGSVALLLEAEPEPTPFLVWRSLTATADQADAPTTIAASAASASTAPLCGGEVRVRAEARVAGPRPPSRYSFDSHSRCRSRCALLARTRRAAS